MRPRALLLVALALPLAASAWASSRLAARAGTQIGSALALAAAALPDPPRPPPIESAVVSETDASMVVIDEDPAPAPGKKPKSTPKAHGVHVRAAAVLRLANAGIRPSGVPVPATADHPAGLALIGVSGLGVGMRDGDVLTEVAGAPATSIGSVVGAVLAARRKHAPAVSGRFFRGSEPWQIVVDQPYPR